MSKASDPRHAQIPATQADFDAAYYEESNVHSVYESIASHFSETRYKPWPLIPAFLNSLPVGSVGADLGCGNGKYLSLRNVLVGAATRQQGIVDGGDILTVGLDRSSNLVDLATSSIVVGERVLDGGSGHNASSDASSVRTTKRRNEVLVGDAISSPYRSRCFDYALSIATIHHFSTRQRRLLAVQELIRIIRPCPSVADSTFEVHPHRTDNQYPAIAQNKAGRFLIYVWALEQRGESRRKFESIKKTEDESGRDLLVPWVQKGQRAEQADDKPNDMVYQRFYHVFEQGELETLVEDAAAQMPHIVVRLETSGWERGNWYGIWQCIDGV